MDVSTSASGGMFATPEAFVGLSPQLESSSAVASLDSPSLQQTKSEIRSLAGEIAQLAHTALQPDEFFEGFLPRLCSAMGAKGAGVWRVGPQSEVCLVAEHLLPASLLAANGPVDSAPFASDPNTDDPFAGDPFADDPTTGEPTTNAANASQPARHSMERLAARFDPAHRVLPSQAHDRILRCVIAEGQPILVPPGNVKIESERPSNPLSDAIIVIPVRIQESVEYLLQVIQRPSGGPAAQRGYLRFVAQMADLMADYLRRQQLRELTKGSQRLQRIEAWLTALAGAHLDSQRHEMAADALRELLSADRAVLLAASPRSKVLALSGSRNFDSRSEIVLAAEALLRKLIRGGHVFQPSTQGASAGWIAHRLSATDRRATSPADSDSNTPSVADARTERDPQLQPATDAFCQGMGCRQAAIIPLDVDGRLWGLLAYPETTDQPTHDFTLDAEGGALRLARAIGGIVGNRSRTQGALGWLSSTLLGRRSPAALLQPNQSGHATLAKLQHQTARQSAQRLAMQWLLRLSLVALLAAIACFPVSQQISATAILQPRNKQMYYAPATAVVTQVMVAEGQTVTSGTPLLQLTSHDLDNQLESLQIELTKTEGEIAEKTSRLNRGDGLSPLQRDQLEFNLRELDSARRSTQLQIANVQQRVDELTIQARAEGTIATWDLKNRLLNHPVQAGQLLASTFDPDDQWSLWLSIPDHRAGLVAAALDSSATSAVKVRFSLASHPDQILEAFAVDMAPQVTVHSSDPHATAARVVRTEALIGDASALPLKKDGAIARATIDCGQVPLVWLVFRDAVWAISSRIRMLW